MRMPMMKAFAVLMVVGSILPSAKATPVMAETIRFDAE